MRILIVKTSAIGDVTHTLPGLHALRLHYPEAHISWLVEEAAADLLQGHPEIDELLISRRKAWAKTLRQGPRRLEALRQFRQFIKKLRQEPYDLLIDFQGLLKSGIFVALAKADRKVGFGRGMAHSEGSWFFLNERIPAVDMDIHAVDRERLLLEAIGVPPAKLTSPSLPINSENHHLAQKILQEHGLQPTTTIPINPIATWPTKLWDNQKFAALADWLVAQGYQVAFTGGPNDNNAIADIMAGMKQPAVNLAGKTRLSTLAALYQQVPFVISTDTGPMHIAAAVGTPVVAIFGSTAPWRTGPYGPQHHIVRLDMDCGPCLKKECASRKCMLELTTDMVIGAVKEVVAAK